MSIRLADGPEAGFGVLETHLSSKDAGPPPFSAYRPRLAANGKVTAIEPLEAAKLVNAVRGPVVPISVALLSTDPYPIYTVSSQDQLDEFLRSAKLTAWHYILVEEADHSIHSLVELAVLGPQGEALSYVSLQPRQYAEMMAQAIDHASKLPQADAQNYELRVLRVSSLSFLGVWLHTDAWTHDWIIAIGDGEPDYEDKRMMNEEQLMTVLGKIAAHRTEAQDQVDV